MDAKGPCAFLFANGNGIYLNDEYHQMVDLQALGWRGLHEFREKYPDAPVSIQYSEPIPAEVMPNVLKQIVDPRPPIVWERKWVSKEEAKKMFPTETPTYREPPYRTVLREEKKQPKKKSKHESQ